MYFEEPMYLLYTSKLLQTAFPSLSLRISANIIIATRDVRKKCKITLFAPF
jgi:hypothetical protein